MRAHKKIIFVFLLSIACRANAQQCEPCGERTLVHFQQIEWLEIQKPEDSVLLNEWNKLNDVWYLVMQRMDLYFEKGSCLYIKQSFRNTTPSTVAKNNKYTIYGIIVQTTSDYYLRLWMHPACGDKIIAETEVRFQMYPFFDIDKIATQAAAQLVPQLQNIYDFEQEQRASKNYGFGGDLSEGYVEIRMDKKMLKGEETKVVIKVVDCDGLVLNNKEISTAGTVGGIFTPAKFTTGSDGSAIVKFKMTTDKTAFIKASCQTKNVWECDDLYTGSEVVKGLGGAPVKVSIHYEQNETHWLNRATLPGIEIAGGGEEEIYEMEHRSVFYYYPSKKVLDEGLLIDAGKEDGYYLGLTDKVPDANARTVYATESGWFFFTKKVENAKVAAMAGDVKMIEAIEQGERIEYNGDASLLHPSEVMFFLGNDNEPPSFMWNVQYPVSNGNIAGGGAVITKGEEGVKWVVNKMTDPKSIYKTEYLLSLTLDAAEELKKGNKAMKDFFGTDLDGFTKIMDPTKPHEQMARASGSQTITVRILSPYDDIKPAPKK